MRRVFLLVVTGIAVAVPLGGGATFVAMELTTRPQFCNSCHIMEPYYASWQNSGHADVACVDCHYEPGLLETFEGKFKAMSQLAKYVTATEGTKPWAEVSDYSCLRSGCHSTRMLEGDIRFGRVRFDHRNHLIGMRRGKQLRCVSCHAQIEQDEHLTVSPATCILCHFRESKESAAVDDCNTCHGPPKEEIDLGGFVFRHSDYLDRGVECVSCHGDVTRGPGTVPKHRCGSCHSVQAHLDRYDDVEFIHKQHVADHSVYCFECHDVIEHALPPREEHYSGDCATCHQGSHGAMTGLYRGTGGKEVADRPGVMFLARVTCNGCHKPPFPGAPVALGGATYKADPLACVDCHGPGFAGMAERWQKELKGHLDKVGGALAELREALTEEWEDGDVEAARRSYDQAAHNYGLVLLDRSGGAHNLPYARDLLRQALVDIGKATVHLDPEESPPTVVIGPASASKEGCTTLCHTGIEDVPVTRAFELPFAHARHFGRGRMDCSKCHVEKPHGTTKIRRADCVSCHHEQEEPQHCGTCHTAVAALRSREVEGAPTAMADLDCLACHETLADGHTQAAVRQSCQECHEDDGADYGTTKFDAWLAAASAPLDALEKQLAGAPPETAARIRKELAVLRAAGPFHNAAFVAAEARRLAAELAK
jgi:nitrate/TMAO reductase-like tetraheme cytochrome c subunit